MKLNQLIKKNSDLDQKDIILVLESVLQTTYSSLMLMDDIAFSVSQQRTFDERISRLKNGEPVQYILGSWDFINLNLKVDKRALIPRPETEILALEGADIAIKFDKPKVLDAGCGTGCIGLYIKSTVPGAEVTLCDISAEAISLAKENAKKLHLDVRFKNKDLRKIDEKFDLIISNPPYITKEDMLALDKSVIDYEPPDALYGGDGLMFYRILSEMHNNLNANGYIALEIGINQSLAVENLLSKNFEDIKIINDFANIPRVITAKKLFKDRLD